AGSTHPSVAVFHAPARAACTASFNPADSSVSSRRICVDRTDRCRNFTLGRTRAPIPQIYRDTISINSDLASFQEVDITGRSEHFASLDCLQLRVGHSHTPAAAGDSEPDARSPQRDTDWDANPLGIGDLHGASNVQE